MLSVKGQLSILSAVGRTRRGERNVDLSGQHAFVECIAGIVLQNLSDPAELVHKTSHACVCGADHWAPIFNTTKDRVGNMLAGTGGMQKPTVICYIDKKVCAVEDKSSDEIADGILKTNQRRDSNVGISEIKDP